MSGHPGPLENHEPALVRGAPSTPSTRARIGFGCRPLHLRLWCPSSLPLLGYPHRSPVSAPELEIPRWNCCTAHLYPHPKGSVRYSAPPILAAARWNAIPAAPRCHMGRTSPLQAAAPLAVDLGMHIQANGCSVSFFTDLYIHLTYGPCPLYRLI